MTKVEGIIGVDQEGDPDMIHLEHQEEIPDQKVTIDQDQALIQDQGAIGQDPIATIDLVTEIRNQNQRVNINAISMGKKQEIIQQ